MRRKLLNQNIWAKNLKNSSDELTSYQVVTVGISAHHLFPSGVLALSY